MSNYITTETADGALLAGWNNFSAVATANMAALGLTAPQLAEITTAATKFSTDFSAMTAARAASEAATTLKDTTKFATKATINKWAKVFRANSAISNALLAQLQLAPHSTPGSFTAPNQPTELVANANGEGWTELKWKRNGNTPGTSYHIFKKNSAGDPWVMVASVTKTKWTTALVPGQYAAFQVVAVRGESSSIPSTPVVLWDSGEGFALELAA